MNTNLKVPRVGEPVVDANHINDEVNRIRNDEAGQPVVVEGNFDHGDVLMAVEPAAIHDDPPSSVQQTNASVAQFTPEEFAAARAICAACGNHHSANSSDVPSVMTAEKGLANFCTRGRDDVSVCDFAWGFDLKHHHVILAINMSRSGVFPDYLAKLMRPYFAASTPGLTNVSIRQLVRPIVTLGERNPSYLLYRETEIARLQTPDAESLDSVSIQHLFVCPHASICGGDHVAGLNNSVIENAIASANRGMAMTKSLSCPRCPTDIQLSTEPGRLTVRIWHDFGTSATTPSSSSWLVHVVSPKNNEFVGPTVAHTKGSVRFRYENEIHRQGWAQDIFFHRDPENQMTAAGLQAAGRALLTYRLHGLQEAMRQ